MQIHEETAWMPDSDAAARAYDLYIAPKWISPDGKSVLLPSVPLTEAGTGPFARAEAIAVDTDGVLYVADSDHNVIYRQSGR